MNAYCQSCLHQIEVAINKTLEIIQHLKEEDLSLCPTSGKLSVGELLVHIAQICKTDYAISLGYTKEEMDAIYQTTHLETLDEIKMAIKDNFVDLKKGYENLSEQALHTQVTSYWGTTYTRYEWLVEILAHIYHHRGQVHAILTHVYGKELNVLMFE